jgi:uncharacterized protein (UPF0261 family)
MPTIVVLGTFDTKGPEHGFVADAIRRRGHTPLLIHVGTQGEPTLTPDIGLAEVAALGDADWVAILKRQDRGASRASFLSAAAAAPPSPRRRCVRCPSVSPR